MTLNINKEGSLYTLGLSIEPTDYSYTAIASTLPKSELDTLKWHYRLGHLNVRSLSLMHSHELVNGLPYHSVRAAFLENSLKVLIH